MDSTLRHRVDDPAARDDVRTRRRERSTSASARGGASRVTAATRDIATRVIDISGARATIATFERRVDRVDVDAARRTVAANRRGEPSRGEPSTRTVANRREPSRTVANRREPSRGLFAHTNRKDACFCPGWIDSSLNSDTNS